MLGVSRAAILTLQFKRISKLLGTHDGLLPRTPVVTGKKLRRGEEIGKTIRIAAMFTPWTSNCFPQAITARLILGIYRIPYALFFGLRKDNKTNELKAHAWVVSGRNNVTGGSSFKQFTAVGCFTSQTDSGLKLPAQN